MALTYDRAFDAARQAQGFRSQAHLDAFFAHYDHTASCAACAARNGYAELDDGLQPTMGQCDEARRLDAATLAASSAPPPVIMVAESSNPRYAWRQYFVITDGRCVIVEMLPALLAGWKFHRVVVQDGGDSWPGYSRDDIVAFKLASSYPPAMAGDLGEFRARLLAVAADGKLPDQS